MRLTSLTCTRATATSRFVIKASPPSFFLQWYNFLLVILCTAYGYMTRKVRSDYRETRYISSAMFTVFLIWSTGLFIVAVVLDTKKYGYHRNSNPYDPELHASVFSIMSCLSGLVVISVMFTNRVYLATRRTTIVR